MKKGLAKTCYRFFSTLANPTRLATLEILSDGPKNVGDLAHLLKQEQSMVSHNLESLEKCMFIFSERREKHRIYSLNRETVEPLFKLFDYHSKKFCPVPGTCLTERGLRQIRKKDASGKLHVTHG
jgi:DNA-binding transcriptional ArsR family regulator